MKALDLAHRSKKIRDTARGYFGHEYNEKVRPYVALVKAVMRDNSCSAIEALLKISKTETYQSTGVGQMLFISAALDVTEEL